MLSQIHVRLARHFRHAPFLALSQTKCSLIPSPEPSPAREQIAMKRQSAADARRRTGWRLALLLPALIACVLPAAAQIEFLGAVESQTSYGFLGGGHQGPYQVAANAAGIVAVANTQFGQIVRILPNGTKQVAAGITSDNVAIDGAGNIYTSTDYRLFKIAPDNTVTIIDTGNHPTLLQWCDQWASQQDPNTCVGYSGPYSIATTSDGYVFMSYQAWGGFVTYIDPSGNPGHSLNQLNGSGGGALATDRQGNVYMVNGYINQIIKMDPAGNTTTIAPPGANITKSCPVGNFPDYCGGESIGVDSQGNIYVGSTNYWGAQNEFMRISANYNDWQTLPLNGGGAMGFGVDSHDTLYFVNNNADLIKYSTRYMDFGNEPVGSTSPSIQAYFAGDGDASLADQEIELFDNGYNQFLPSEPALGEFGGAGGILGTIGNDSLIYLPVTFAPSFAGLRTGAVTDFAFTLNPPFTNTIVATVPVFGVGTAAAPVFDSGWAQPSNIQITSSVLSTPGETVYDGFGDLFVSYPFVGQVWVVPPTGNPFELPFGSSLSKPTGLAVDPVGDLYVADAGTNSLYLMQSETSTLSLPSDPNLMFHQGVISTLNIPGLTLNNPSQICFDKYGDLFIANTGSGDIVEVSPQNAVTVVASGLS
jgi:hypothetical protein